MSSIKSSQNGQKFRSNKLNSKQSLEYWERKLPPINELCLGSLAFIIIDGIYIAAHLPKLPSMTVVTIFLSLGGVLVALSCLGLYQIKQFAWDKFFLVLRWMSLEYLVEAGMLEYIFSYDDVRGKMLLVLTLALIIFAIDIPIIVAFTVARYQVPSNVRQ